MDLTLNVEDCIITANNHRAITVVMEGVDEDELFDDLGIQKFIDHFGLNNILNHIGINDVKNYFNLTEKED